MVTTRAIPLRQIQQEFGGYSGGFKDGPWACLNPFRSFYGPIGGVRSELEVDQHHFRNYMNSVVVCIHDNAWKLNMTGSSPTLFIPSLPLLVSTLSRDDISDVWHHHPLL
jgi:hypothetical protein